jgi:hypothetical protein
MAVVRAPGRCPEAAGVLFPGANTSVMGNGDTGLNALIGGIVTVVTAAFVPFASVLGGAVAGYLQRGDRRGGAVVGALSGVIALVPVGLILLLAGGFLLGIAPVAVPEAAGLFAAFVLLVFAAVAAYLVGFGALGGVLGVYVATETDLGD